MTSFLLAILGMMLSIAVINLSLRVSQIEKKLGD